MYTNTSYGERVSRGILEDYRSGLILNGYEGEEGIFRPESRFLRLSGLSVLPALSNGQTSLLCHLSVLFLSSPVVGESST